MNAQEPKQLLQIAKSTRESVGDGFEIRRAMPVQDIDWINPFMVLDHAGPTQIAPSETPRGVQEHPHRGFETVTVLYQGEIAHRDSGGNSGLLKAGDVQWMTAAAGIVHEEMHGKEFTRRGGTIELVQLWVNLPAAHKSEQPGYQDIRSEDIPVVPLGSDSFVRVIAGEFNGTRGAARTFTPVSLFDIKLSEGAQISIPSPNGHSAGIYVTQGELALQSGETLSEGHIAAFALEGNTIVVQAVTSTRLLVVGGEPINEPMVSYGPFVMNTEEEIYQAFADYRAGKMGTLDIRIKASSRSKF